jgi:hypothetical protein
MHRTQRCFLASGCSTYCRVRAPRPTRPGRRPQRRPLRAPWTRILGAATTAMFLHRRGAATTKAGPCRRNPLGRWGSRPISALLVVDDARASTPPRALTSAREPHRRTALGTPAGPLGRKPRWAQHLAALATKPGEICGLAVMQPYPSFPCRFFSFAATRGTRTCPERLRESTR